MSTTIVSILAFIVGVVLAIFSFQNTSQVRVNFLGWSTEYAPLALIILASALAGLALGYLLGLRSVVRRSLELRRQNKRIRELEAQQAVIPGATHSDRDADTADANRPPR